MARLIRIEFENAVYHVTARGNERRDVYRDDKDRDRFLEALEGAETNAAVGSLFVDGTGGDELSRHATTYPSSHRERFRPGGPGKLAWGATSDGLPPERISLSGGVAKKSLELDPEISIITAWIHMYTQRFLSVFIPLSETPRSIESMQAAN